MLLSTQVSHTLEALREVLSEAGGKVVQRAAGVLEVVDAEPADLLSRARSRLSSVEADEVRVVVLGQQDGDALLALAMSAPTLSQLGARVTHADLLPLFADELGAFRSVYQPIVAFGASEDTTVIGYEALLRATGAAGQVMPTELFAAAQQAGWLHVLDRVGRTTALRGAGPWLGDDLLFVNFLPTTIYRPEVCLATTERAARLAGLRLEQLVFEVTESEQITDLDHLEDVFGYYRERGCKVALDDLGAGYSSLNLLVRLQPDVVKLDKDIVQRLPDTVSAAVVAAVVNITHSYGGRVLAECVETAEQARAARDLGVDLAQGWLFGRPEERGQRRGAPRSFSDPATRVHARQSWATGPGGSGIDPAVALRAEPAAPQMPAVPAAPQVPTVRTARGVSVAPTVPAPSYARSVLPVRRGTADVEALVTQALRVCSAGVSIADATSRDMPLIYVNEAFERATGYRAPEVLGRNCRFLQGPDTSRELVREVREAIAAGRDHVSVLRNYRKDGSGWWNELRLSPVRNELGAVTHYFGFQNDVTARVEAQERLAHLAYHDPLTGLPNRAQLMAGLQRELARARRHGSRLAVLFIDLDGFKNVNDRLGHAAGDLVLTAAAARLRGVLRDADLLGRHSGDEFVAVVTDVPADTADRIAHRVTDAVLDSFHSPLDTSDQPVRLGASIGVALFPEHGQDAHELLLAADRAMYAAKDAGRGRAILAAPPGPDSARVPGPNLP